jgi:fatty acid desaturase
LFPNISHIHYPQLSVEVQAFCRRQGLSYHSYSWGEALWKSWAVLRFPQQVVRQEELVENSPLLKSA